MKKIEKYILTFVLLFTFLFMAGCDSTKSIELHLDANSGMFDSGKEIIKLKSDNASDFVLPQELSKDGYTFDGWFFDNNTFLEPFSINLLNEKNTKKPITIYAKWLEGSGETPLKTFKVSFQTNGGTSIDPIEFEKGESFTISSEPKRNGFSFDGWYLDAALTVSLDTIGLTHNLDDFTLYAKWQPIIVTEGLLFVLKTDDTYELSGYTGSDSDLYIPSSHQGLPVTSIGRIESTIAFTSIHLPASIDFIDDGMLSYGSLTSISVSDNSTSYKTIDGVLFDKNLETLIWYPSARGSSYTVPEGVKHIGEGVFRSNRTISSVILPDSLTSIQDKAFWGTESLTSIVIPNNVKSIGWNAFYVSSLETVSFGSNLESIAQGAFAGTDIASISLPDTILTIGNEAFAVCGNLVSITIYAATPPTLGTDAFRSMVLGGYNDGLSIYVLNNSVNLYKDAASWDTYSDIITNIS